MLCLSLLLAVLCVAGAKVAQVSGDQRRIFSAQFRPDSNTKFVSCGVKHVRFWSLVGTELIGKKGYLPKSSGAKMQTMLSLAFAPVSIRMDVLGSGCVGEWMCCGVDVLGSGCVGEWMCWGVDVLGSGCGGCVGEWMCWGVDVLKG